MEKADSKLGKLIASQAGAPLSPVGTKSPYQTRLKYIQMYTYMYIYICAHVHTTMCTHIHTSMHAYIHTCIHTYAHRYMFISNIHTCFSFMYYVYIYVYIHTHMHMRVYIYMYISRQGLHMNLSEYLEVSSFHHCAQDHGTHCPQNLAQAPDLHIEAELQLRL